MSSTSPRKRGDLEDLTFYVLQVGRPPWDAERDMQLIRQRGGIVIDDPGDATIVIIDTPAARPDRETKHRVYKYAEPLADDAPVDEWTVDLLVRRFATEDSGTIVLLSKWLQKNNAAFGPLYSGYLVRGVHVPAESEDEEPEPPEPPMPDIPSDNGSDYEPAEEKVSTPAGKGKGKQRADSDEEYSPAGARKRTNGRHKAVESPKARRGRRKKQDSSSDIEFVGSSQPQGWKRFMVDTEEEDEPVKRGPGRPRKVVPEDGGEVAKRGPGRPRKPTFAANPPTPRASMSGAIFATGRYPLTFYVAPSDNDLLERLIPSAGGGDLVSASEANIVILPLAQGEAPTTREHIKLVENARGGVARVVSEDWAWDCFRAHPPTLLDLAEYEVSLDGAGSSQRNARAVPSSQRSAPSSSQRHASASSQAKRAASSSQSTPAKRPRASSTLFEEDHRWDSSRRTNHEMAYYEDDELDFDSILEEHVERVELLIHYLRRWDKQGDKGDFIKSLAKTNSVRGAIDIYYNKGYQHLIDRQVPGLMRAGRRASGKVVPVTSTPSKAAPVASSTSSKAKTTRPRRDPDEINVELIKEDQKERVVELIKALREWDKTGSKSQKLKDLGREIPGAMTLYYAHRDLVERQVPGL
ncbi:uncharacterized protein LOC62_04G005971 [Vanrija pseudolonga]|uniref:BRCT domain-containing protein n=1 Tax=Vanrija pseudolonga TaxID=143232 RepID=A0AAF1BRQ0_9TREE|nr:hypothetical protein LOC62_04G005971 [Vanrija pseudolonga]